MGSISVTGFPTSHSNDVSKFQDFFSTSVNFKTFQVLKNPNSNFRTFQDPLEPSVLWFCYQSWVELVEFNVPLDIINRSFWRRVFPANHLAMILTKQTYNNQDKYKKPKDIHKKLQKLNQTKTRVVINSVNAAQCNRGNDNKTTLSDQ